jgi:hypothetical protein
MNPMILLAVEKKITANTADMETKIAILMFSVKLNFSAARKVWVNVNPVTAPTTAKAVLIMLFNTVPSSPKANQFSSITL